MGVLKKHYELSLWDDVFEEGKYVEKKIAIIGSTSMKSQSRAIEPELTKNVNGTKKLTFKMYKYYTDIISGEEVENEFIPELYAERKVKLKYGDDWYDFIIKQIDEKSSDYTNTYLLEDAHVCELLKNGFNVVLDIDQMNNMGTADQLAERALADTGWTVKTEDKEILI
jgi:hypothetical protein